MVHRAPGIGTEAHDDRRSIDIRVLGHMNKCVGLDTLAVLDQLEPSALQQEQASFSGGHSSSFAGSSQSGGAARVRGRAIDWRNRTRSSFDGLHLRDSSPTSLNDSDKISQLAVERWTIKEVQNGRPTRAVPASPLDRLEGTFDLPIPGNTATLSTGYSRMSMERWLKYLHQTSEGCSLQLDARLGSAQQLTTVAEAVKQQQQCAGQAKAPPDRPSAVSLASNNLGLEALPSICNLCAVCPALKSLDLSHNRHLFSVPLEVDVSKSLALLFFSSPSFVSGGEVLHLYSTELDAIVPENSAVSDSNIHTSNPGIHDYTQPSELQALVLNGNIIGTSMSGLLSSCLLRQQLATSSSKACGLQELHLEDAELDAVAFSTLLWGPSAGPQQSSQSGSNSVAAGHHAGLSTTSRGSLHCTSRPASASGVSADSGSPNRQSLMGGQPQVLRTRVKSKRTSNTGASSSSAKLAAASTSGSSSSDGGSDVRLGHPALLHSRECSKDGETPQPARVVTASALKCLRVLNLAGCLQAGKQLFGLARMIAQGCSLERLNLADIGASASGYKSLSTALWTNSSLMELSLVGSDLPWAATFCVALALMRHQCSLKRLNVSRCRLPALGLSALLKAAATSDSLERLHFAGVYMLKSPSAHPNDTDPAEVSQPAQDLESSPRKEKTGSSAKRSGSTAGLKTDNTTRPSALPVPPQPSLDTQAANLKSKSLATTQTSTSTPGFDACGANLIRQVMSNSIGAISKQKSCGRGGPVSHRVDLSTLDGWSSVMNCFSRHIAGSAQCSCVQAPVSVASPASRKYKTLLSADQLEDASAVAEFCGDMQESGTLTLQVASLGNASTGEPAETKSAALSEELFTCMCQEMQGRTSSAEWRASASRRARPQEPDDVWRQTVAAALVDAGVTLSAQQKQRWKVLVVMDH